MFKTIKASLQQIKHLAILFLFFVAMVSIYQNQNAIVSLNQNGNQAYAQTSIQVCKQVQLPPNTMIPDGWAPTRSECLTIASFGCCSVNGTTRLTNSYDACSMDFGGTNLPMAQCENIFELNSSQTGGNQTDTTTTNKSNGEYCTSNTQCTSGSCRTNVCANPVQGNINSTCYLHDKNNNTCSEIIQANQVCGADVNNRYITRQLCEAQLESTGTGGTSNLPNGQACTSNSQCISTFCKNNVCTRQIAENSQCFNAGANECTSGNTCQATGSGFSTCRPVTAKCWNKSGQTCISISSTNSECNPSAGSYPTESACRATITASCWNRSGQTCVSISSTNSECNPSAGSYPTENACKSSITCDKFSVGACVNGRTCTGENFARSQTPSGVTCNATSQIYACWNRSGNTCTSLLSSNRDCNPSLGSYPSEATCKSTINCRTAGEGTCLNGKTCTGDDFDKSRAEATGLSCGTGAGGNSPKQCYEIKNNTCVSTASNFLGLCNTFTQYNSYNICKSALDQKNNGGNTNTGGTGTSTQCLADLAACGSERGLSDTCCGTAICQGYTNNRRCENPGLTGDQICGAGSTCTGWAGFKCDALHTSPSAPGGQLVCEENGQLFTDRTGAVNHAGQCGQIDKVCVGGSNAGKLCGEFNIINNNCGVPPVPTPTPTPTPPVVLSCDSNCTSNAQCQAADSRFTCHAVGGGVSKCRLATNTASAVCQPAVGPMCLSLTKTNVTDATRTTPKLGDAISLTCGEVPLATRYIFRIVQPDGTILNLNGTGRTSEPFVISKSGHYTAQCQICTGAEASTCLPYEPVK